MFSVGTVLEEMMGRPGLLGLWTLGSRYNLAVFGWLGDRKSLVWQLNSPLLNMESTGVITSFAWFVVVRSLLSLR